MLWFARFELYRELGPARTIEDVWRLNKAQQSAPSTSKRPHNRWYEVARELDWQARAEAWDEEQIAQERTATQLEVQSRRQHEAQEREVARQGRRNLLKLYLDRIVQVLPETLPVAKMDELTRAIQMLAQELRAEYNDLPTQRLGFMAEADLDAAIAEELQRIGTGLAVLAGSGEGAAT